MTKETANEILKRMKSEIIEGYDILSDDLLAEYTDIDEGTAAGFNFIVKYMYEEFSKRFEKMEEDGAMEKQTIYDARGFVYKVKRCLMHDRMGDAFDEGKILGLAVVDNIVEKSFNH